MNRAAQQRSAIRRLMSVLGESPIASDAQQMVVEEARRLTEAATAALCLLADGGEMLDFVAVAGENADDIVGLRIRIADSLSESVLATGEPVLVDERAALETGDLFAFAEDELVTGRIGNREQGTGNRKDARSIQNPKSKIHNSPADASPVPPPLFLSGRTGALSGR